MKSFKNEGVTLMETPDDRVGTMKKFSESNKPLFITILPEFDDEYKLGSVIYEENENVGGPVVNCIGGRQGTIISSAVEFCFNRIAKQIKEIKKEDRYDLIYFSGDFEKRIGEEVALSFENILFQNGIEIPIIIEVSTPEVWDFSDDDKKKDKKKKKKKKK